MCSQLGFVQEYLCTILPNALKHLNSHEPVKARSQCTQTRLTGQRKKVRKGTKAGKLAGYLG